MHSLFLTHQEELATPPRRLLYLSGSATELPEGRADLGLLLTPKSARRFDLTRWRWAADTGCFRQGDAFRLDGYLAWLDRLRPFRQTCLFATAPDVVSDAEATLARSLPVLPQIRALGFPAALVAQDGLEGLPVPWGQLDALFTGGTTRWKLDEAAYTLVREAHRRGKWTHMGRVNSLRRMRAALVGGYDSADGTFMVRAPRYNLPRLERWLGAVSTQGAFRL